MKITREFLYAIAPGAKAAYVDAIVVYQDLLAKYGITSQTDIAWFFGQFATETSGITALEESLYYTSAARIRQVWPSRFKKVEDAQPYVRNPAKLANLVYGGRLGNVNANDGWLYRGSGGFHTTGKANYQRVQDATGVPCVADPGLLRQFPAALESACVYWRDNKLSRFVGNVEALTKAVQGGTGGLADRKLYTNRALAALNKSVLPVPPAATYLKLGSRSDAVKTLQERLLALGFDMVGKPDGIFGDATADAVKQFQKRAGLIADGIAGPNTLKLIYSPNQVNHAEPALPKPSGLDNFFTWLAGLFRR